MRVGNYRVWWKYPNDSTTECFIEIDSENHDNPEEIRSLRVGYGLTERSPKDSPCKEVGRRLSFKRALHDAFPVNSRTQETYKNLRRKFWEAYRTLTKTPKWGVKNEENT